MSIDALKMPVPLVAEPAPERRHAHHRAVHAGHVRITGRAPDRLRFELGALNAGTPLMVDQGNHITRGPFDLNSGS